MARSTKEWIGKTDDSTVPDRVRLRVFDRFDGRCQCGCNRPIRPGEAWRLDHKIALILGGEHREGNFQPIITEHDKDKVRAEVAAKAKTYKRRKSHHGIRKAKHPIAGWRKFDGTIVRNPKLRVGR